MRRFVALLPLLGLAACGRGERSGGASGGGPAAALAASGDAPAAADAAAPARRRAPPLPAVGLDGAPGLHAATVPAPGRPRVHAKAQRVWIHERPSARAARVGYLRAGASSPTGDGPAGREGCRDGWYSVEPEGFVCVGSGGATLDGEDPIVVATREHAPDPLRKLPYIYGTVRRPGPVYAGPPARSDLDAAEPDLGQRMESWLRAEGEVGAGYAQHVWLGGPGEPPDPARAWEQRASDPLPAGLTLGRTVPGFGKPREGISLGRMKPKVGYSFLHTFLHEGRRYGLTTALEVVATDRLRPIQGSDFQGFAIGLDVTFPFAIVRRPDARLWTRSKGKLLDAGAAPYRAPLALSGKQNFFDGRLHFETRDGRWVSDRDASRLDAVRRMPKWGKDGERWIDVNVTKQTLVLYEGTRAVYATLVSTGEAGLEDPNHSTATKRGIFRIHTKHVSATMASDEIGEEFELRDVPYVQYFDEGYALHGAYWHDRFGVPKSHGCINLAPEDARRIFYWTEPALPTGWHGVLLPLRGTTIFVHP
ncbi:MAG: L,D-transpeptidase [Polyangiaceae bacterium]|nr:L,D-transpeptidase [Polyangiaceae bacterium]